MLPAGKGGLENTSKSPPGRILGLDHPFAELLFLRISFRDSLPRNCVSNFVLCLVSVGVEIVLERPVIMKEQEEGGNSLEVVIPISSWSMPVRHDFIYFEVVAFILVQGGEDWL